MASVLALVFDFDDTLLPDSTTQLLNASGEDAKRFFDGLIPLAAEGYDPTVAFLNSFLDWIATKKPPLASNGEALHRFGRSLGSSFFPGLPELFADLRETTKRFRLGIEFYIVSGGLQDLVEGAVAGTPGLSGAFASIYACRLAEEGGVFTRIKRCITFTEKTRYLFEINKGITPEQTLKAPYLVNEEVEESRRRVPLRNMIYVGDGLTDIPCFSLLKKSKGLSFGVFDPTKPESANRAFLKFLQTGRVAGPYAPEYGREQTLGSLIRAAVAARCAAIQVENQAF